MLWSERAVVGSCIKVRRLRARKPGDCELGTKGQLLGPANFTKRSQGVTSWAAAAERCLAACSGCSRCRYVSLSLRWTDCSWYHTCPVTHSDMRDFISVAANGITPLPLPQAPAAASVSGQSRRDALALPGAWPWFQPTSAGGRVAVLLIGAIGGFGGVQESASARGPDAGDPKLLISAHASFRTHVIEANPDFALDVFCHSWNPSLGLLIDSLYHPVWSSHEPRHSNHSVVSYALSLHRALLARSLFSTRRWLSHDLVAALRYDLHWYRPLVWRRLPRAQLWLFGQCCQFDPAAVPVPFATGADRAAASNHRGGLVSLPEHLAYADRAASLQTNTLVTPPSGPHAPLCPPSSPTGSGGSSSASVLVSNCPLSWYLRAGGQHSALAEETEHGYAVNDWGFIAPPQTASTFSELSLNYAAYESAISEIGIRVSWMHFFFATHIVHAIRASAGVRVAALAHIDVTLTRRVHFSRVCPSSNTLDLPSTMIAQQHYHDTRWAGMPQQLCPMQGAIVCTNTGQWLRRERNCTASSGHPTATYIT